MGRPKKEQIEAAIAEDIALQSGEPATPDIKDSELKVCPKCGSKATGPWKDSNGNYRCNCSEKRCAFWDSVVSYTPQEAARRWQLAGGPNKE